MTGQEFKRKFLKYCTHVKIDSKEEGTVALKLNGCQRYLVEEIADALDNNIHHFVILKSRQLGISTIMLALVNFWMTMHPGLQGAVITDSDENKQYFRSILNLIHDTIPKGLKVRRLRDNGSFRLLANQSRIMYLTAGVRRKSDKKTSLGRAKGLNFLHACVLPGTPVIVKDGFIKPIEKVEIGDWILTHTGAYAQVIDAVGQPNTKGDLIKITPWLGKPLCFTEEHTIPTQRGIIEAKDVKPDDLLVMPIRKITSDETQIQLPVTPPRKQKGGAVSIGSGEVIKLTEEFGYFCGYYLSEGHILYQRKNGKASAIQFARHRDEKDYAIRAVKAVRKYISSHRIYDKTNCLTTVEYVYGSALAQWVEKTFGGPHNKFIPDDVFAWGEEFCRGLLAGILCGDGSKKNKPNQGYESMRVTLPTISSSLAMQVRDIAASLGYGWASCSHAKAKLSHGRWCKEQWRIVWCGTGARQLRGLMGCESPENGRPRTEKSRVVGNSIQIKIRKIETGIKADYVWDLSVDHRDHTFRTPYMSIGNTESSSWVDEDGLKSLMSSLAETFPDRLYVFESTAQGFDLFYDMWNTAKESTTQKAIFIGWWRNERYRIERNDKRFSVYWDGVLTQEEQVWVKNIKELYDYDVAIEQITWYRWKYQEQMKDPTKGVNMMSQEFPHTENDAFVLTGHKFFSTTRLTEDFKRAVDLRPRYFKYTFGFNFYDTQVKETNEWNADVAIWQEPSDQGVYVIGADCAFAGNKDSDAHAAHVLRCYADKAVQVAEFRDPFMTTTQYAWVLAHLAGAYSGRFHQCWLNLETNGPGTSVLEELNKVQQMAGAIPDMLLKDEKNIFSNVVPNIAYFIGLNPRGVNTKNYTIGWNTSNQTRSWIFNTFRSVWAQKLVEVNSKWLLREMRYVSQDGKDIVVEGKAKSDRVVAAALAAHHWYMHLVPDLKQKNMIYVVEEKRELLARENVGISNAVQTCVTKHFQRRGIDT